mgnify:CR=1 FL=1
MSGNTVYYDKVAIRSNNPEYALSVGDVFGVSDEGVVMSTDINEVSTKKSVSLLEPTGIYTLGDQTIPGFTKTLVNYREDNVSPSFQTIGSGEINHDVYSIVGGDVGTIYVGGDFGPAYGLPLSISSIAKWDGAKWTGIGGTTIASGSVCNILRYDYNNRVLYVAGVMNNSINGTFYLAYLNVPTNTWTVIPNTIATSEIKSLYHNDNTLVVSYDNLITFSNTSNIYDTTAYITMGGSVKGFSTFEDYIYMCGNFTMIMAASAPYSTYNTSIITKYHKPTGTFIPVTPTLTFNADVTSISVLNPEFIMLGGNFSELLYLENGIWNYTSTSIINNVNSMTPFFSSKTSNGDFYNSIMLTTRTGAFRFNADKTNTTYKIAVSITTGSDDYKASYMSPGGNVLYVGGDFTDFIKVYIPVLGQSTVNTSGVYTDGKLDGEIINMSPTSSIQLIWTGERWVKTAQTGEVVINSQTTVEIDKNNFRFGDFAGQTNQGNFSGAIGPLSGNYNQGDNSIAIGYGAGQYSQSEYSIALGREAGKNSQSTKSIAIGNDAGNLNQGSQSMAIGLLAGAISQSSNCIAIGISSGSTGQQTETTAIGMFAGQNNQSQESIAIGNYAGQNSQGRGSVAIGRFSSSNTQGNYSTSIGNYSGNGNQGYFSVAIGDSSGRTNQGDRATAVGRNAGYTGQGNQTVAVGNDAGFIGQSQWAVCVGAAAGYTSQGTGAVAVGLSSAYTSQGTGAVALGRRAGNSNQGDYAIALGFDAGKTSQSDNSIVINASSIALDGSGGSDRCYIRPIRQWSTHPYHLTYNNTTNEVTYETGFTGKHTIEWQITNDLEPGYIVDSTGIPFNTLEMDDALPGVHMCTTDMSKKAVGVVHSVDSNSIVINSLGDGLIMVTDIGGPLEIGDYLCTSNIPGIARKQGTDHRMNYTIAKMTVNCDFSIPSPTYVKRTRVKAVREVTGENDETYKEEYYTGEITEENLPIYTVLENPKRALVPCFYLF